MTMGGWPFHPVVQMEGGHWVLDLTRPPPKGWTAPFTWTVGRYDEARPWMYATDLFEGRRHHHIGLDLGGPAGTPVHAFARGRIHALGVETEEGGYGPTIVTEHEIVLDAEVDHPWAGSARPLWVLHGHLSTTDMERWSVGDRVEKGEVLGHLGSPEENGGWSPHVHVQLATEAPDGIQMQGVVAPEDVTNALLNHPDPRLVLGALY
jgi:murein DD-endopeptidase MepM/ murein hydrolase activator NlpD